MQPPRHDSLIRAAEILDGTGRAPFRGDVALQKGRIAKIGNLTGESANQTVDASGLILIPGFIDVHTHSDFNPFLYPGLHQKICQGVTTEIMGNCGMSAAPVLKSQRDMIASVWSREGVDLQGELPWETVGEYLSALEMKGLQCHAGFLAGHGNLRFAVVGTEPRDASDKEISEMEKMLRQALEQGALGISFGLVYLPGVFAKKEELIRLCRVTAEANGIAAFHIRSESRELIEAVEETIDVCRQSRCRVQISHLKAAGNQNWPKISRAFELIERAREEGLPLYADAYPYTASYAELAVILPKSLFAREYRIDYFKEKKNHSAIEKVIKEKFEDQPGFWKSIVVANVVNEQYYGFEGKNLEQCAGETRETPEHFLIRLLADNDFRVSAFSFSQNPKVVDQVMTKPYVFAGSDSIADGSRHPHPRAYATLPRFLSRYAKDSDGCLSAKAVERITSLPARHFGLEGRGLIREGAMADLVLLDPAEVRDSTTYQAPKAQVNQGVRWVFLNGEAVVQNGVYTGAKHGRILRRASVEWAIR